MALNLTKLRATRAGRWGLNGAVFVLFVLAWDWAVRASGIHSMVIPVPLDVARALLDGLVGRGVYWDHIGVTVIETLAGFALGAVVGIVIGVIVAESKLLEAVFYPYILAFQTIPKVAIAPLFVIWLGFGLASKIAIAATISFFPVVVNVIAGLGSADQSRLEMLAVFGASRWERFKLVKLPSSLPYVFAGVDIAVGLSVIGAIVAEFVGSQQGIGYLIMQYNFNMNAAGIFALLIVLSLIGIVLHVIVVVIQDKVVFWTKSSSTVIGL